LQTEFFSFLNYTGFGPMLLAMLAFLAVHAELEMKMLGTLRALGLRESVYWMSWQIPFIVISLINALLGAMTAKLIDANQVHVYQHVYFGGMFGSLFFLNLALVSASLFLAACCGTSRHAAPWLVMLMFIGAWVPFLVIASTSTMPYSSGVTNNGLSASPTGLFWVNANTVRTANTSQKEVQHAYSDFPSSGSSSFLALTTVAFSRLMDHRRYRIRIMSIMGMIH
jgi:hypothetical protein